MLSTNDFSAIAALDLDPIKVKLMHGKAGKGWSRERADAVEREYRRFLYLVKTFPDQPIAPVVDVDEFWHYHILDTRKYADDCQRVFGYFLHHFPYAGMRGKQDEEALQRVGKRTGALYEQAFGQPYMSDLAAVGGRAGTAMSSAVRLVAAYGAPAVESAWCIPATVQPAYCYTASATQTVEPAYCYATVAENYCFATSEQLATENSSGAVTSAAYCFIDTPPMTTRLRASRPPEERVGFYLERPRLANA